METTGIDETQKASSIVERQTEQREKMRLIPNPAMNLLTIITPDRDDNDAFDFFIYNFSGTLIQSGSSNERTKIELELAKGMYLVKVKTEATWYTEKLLIH